MSLPEGVTRHAWERAAERLGRPLSRQEWRQVVLDITEGRAVLLLRQNDGSEILLVTVGTVAMRLVWMPDPGCVRTVLPDSPCLTAASETVRGARVRKSVRGGGFYVRGKWKHLRTIWNDKP